MLGAGLPRIQKEFARFEEDLTGALGMVRSSHEQLLHIPAQFQLCVQQIAEQIAGVVAAVQVHDITRQQLEHVEESLELIAARMHRAEETAEPEQALAKEWAQVAAGLAIQSYQLRSTQQAVSGWLRQIGVCMDGIVRISSSEVMGIGPLVLKQEEDLSAQLGRIEQIEQACQADNAEVQSTFAGLENLMQLVAEHVEKSRIVRDRLQLLTFNSIVEASHLGSKADAILEISQSIKRISVTWSGMTDHSAESMNQILQLVETAREDMQAFSAGGSVALQAAQEETRLGLESLRNSAGTASGKAAEVESAISNLQARVEAVGKTRDSLEASFSVVGQTLEHVDAVLLQVERDYPGSGLHWDARAAEADFGSYYTTELEREVLQAALRGDPLPEAQHNLSGNDVELF